MIDILVTVVEYFDGWSEYSIWASAVVILFFAPIGAGLIGLIFRVFDPDPDKMNAALLMWIIVNGIIGFVVFLLVTDTMWHIRHYTIEEAVLYGSIVAGIVLFLAAGVVVMAIEIE